MHVAHGQSSSRCEISGFERPATPSWWRPFLAFLPIWLYLLRIMKSESEAHLFSPLKVRSVTLRNRIGVSPMCQYSATDGVANDWHGVHYGARAVGGAGLVIVEATAVAPEGRITPGCLGLWSEAQAEPLARIAAFMKQQGAVPAIQIAHAAARLLPPCHGSAARIWRMTRAAGPPLRPANWPLAGSCPRCRAP